MWDKEPGRNEREDSEYIEVTSENKNWYIPLFSDGVNVLPIILTKKMMVTFFLCEIEALIFY